MKRISKKIISLILSLALTVGIIGVMPTAVKAEAGSAYPAGISVTPYYDEDESGHAIFSVVEQDNGSGSTYTRLTDIESYGWSYLKVEATEKAGLEPCTQYTVTITAVCDGTSGNLAYHTDSSATMGTAFTWKAPGGTVTFTVTTDLHGEFTETWDRIYMNTSAAWNYLDFTNVSIAKAYSADAAELVTDNNSAYGTGVIIAPTRHTLDNYERIIKTVEDESDEDYGKQYLRMGVKNAHYVYLTIAATADAGLTPYTDYTVVVDVITDGDGTSWVLTGSAINIKENAEGTIQLKVTTDRYGEFSYTYTDSYLHGNGTYIDFKDVTIVKTNSADADLAYGEDSVYGKGIAIIPGAYNSSNIPKRTLKTVTEGENAGLQYTGIEQSCTWSTLTILANREAGLGPNVEYKVIVTVEVEGVDEAETNKNVYYDTNNSFSISAAKTSNSIEFTVSTDENGEFLQTWTSIYHRLTGWTVSFVDISITQTGDADIVTGKNSVYGPGVSIVPKTDVSTFLITKKTVTDVNDEDYGKTYNGIGQITTGSSSLSVIATKEANLEPYTIYSVEIDVASDWVSANLGYYDTAPNGWQIDSNDEKITFEITTDKYGAFTKTWSCYKQATTDPSYVDFVDITITKKTTADADLSVGSGSVYGEGIIIAPIHQNSLAFTRTLKTNGEGMTYNGIATTTGGWSGLQVAATYEAGLKRNADYKMIITTECDDEASGLLYFTDGSREGYTNFSSFKIQSSSGSIAFVKTTDENGEFEVSWNNIYKNVYSNFTYLDFTDISVGLLGDANENKDWDVIDMIQMKKHMGNIEITGNTDLADMNQSGTMTDDDLHLLRQKLVGM